MLDTNPHIRTRYARLILAGLQGKPMYYGPDDDGPLAGRHLTFSKLERRRAAAKRARVARKANRK